MYIRSNLRNFLVIDRLIQTTSLPSWVSSDSCQTFFYFNVSQLKKKSQCVYLLIVYNFNSYGINIFLISIFHKLVGLFSNYLISKLTESIYFLISLIYNKKKISQLVFSNYFISKLTQSIYLFNFTKFTIKENKLVRILILFSIIIYRINIILYINNS